MENPDRTEVTLRRVAALFVLLAAVSAQARPHKPAAWARSQFATAEHLHQLLESRPPQELTRTDYQHVIDAYRRVYLEAPASGRADPSVAAAAGLTEEMGRRFKDNGVLRSAIQQYEFLRRQYPGSKSRFGALFRIGEIHQDDLHDQTHANAIFKEFVRRYPRNPLAEEARKALSESIGKSALKADLKPKESLKAASSDVENRDSKLSAQKDGDRDSRGAAKTVKWKLAHVNGIRHWATADFTRVAVDLDHDVKYESQRIDHPNRVVFDLFDTNLDSKLRGRSFDLNDGLVKKIRISQFKPRQTRVVLETNDAEAFDASLLSDPPRLVIAVRNKQATSAPEMTDIRSAAQAKDEKRTVRGNSVQPIPIELTENLPLASSRQTVRDFGAASIDTSNHPGAHQLKPCSDNDQNSEDCEADSRGQAVLSSAVVPNNGVKTTIVYADDRVVTRETAKQLDPPEIEPAFKTSLPVTSSRQTKGSAGKGRKATATDLAVREARPTASGDRSLIRALGLKIGTIVIDPGHGGHDTGSLGPRGLEEKVVVLDVSRRLGKLLESRLGSQVVYTRTDDSFVPLETRTAIANDRSADLFVSIHANSSHDAEARGVETYYLNFTSLPEALEVAARENAVSEESIHQLQDLVKKIALKEKIEESREFAANVQRSLHNGLSWKNPGLRNRGVKKAPFIVLIGANMPSILAEISFVSNPSDERRLQTAEYRQRIAESLYRGIAKYVSGLSGVKVASRIEKDQGQ